MAERKSSRFKRDDGLSVRKVPGRHDAGYVPRGYRLTDDLFPVLAGPPKGARAATEEDKALVRRAIAALRWEATHLAWVIGDDAEHPLGPDDVPFDDAQLERARSLLKVAGSPRPFAPEDQLERHLALALRYREQARVQRRLREARGSGRVEEDGATEGKALVASLLRLRRLLPAWLVNDPTAQGRLAEAVDALEAVNLGGKGGRGRGRTPEAWARAVVRHLAARFAGNSKP